jgi:hypothetical protein
MSGLKHAKVVAGPPQIPYVSCQHCTWSSVAIDQQYSTAQYVRVKGHWQDVSNLPSDSLLPVQTLTLVIRACLNHALLRGHKSITHMDGLILRRRVVEMDEVALRCLMSVGIISIFHSGPSGGDRVSPFVAFFFAFSTNRLGPGDVSGNHQ